MSALDVISIPDTVLQRTSLNMTEEVWEMAWELLKAHNEHRKSQSKRPLSREQFIELCLRWAFSELREEMAQAVREDSPTKTKRKAS